MKIFNHYCDANKVNWHLSTLPAVFILFVSSTFERSDALIFYIKSVSSISHAYGSSITMREAIKKHPFHSLNNKQRSKLCTDARKYAFEKEIALKYVSTENAELNAFTISEERNKSGEDQIGLKCPTIPSILLAVPGTGNVVNKVEFMVEKNPFLEYTFLEDIIAGFQRKIDIAVETYFSNLNETQKWELCAAAKTSLDYDITMLTDNDWSERVVGMFDVVYPNGVEVDFDVALECNSSPRMYLRNSGIPANTGGVIFMIMLKESEIISPPDRHDLEERSAISVSSQENFVSASTCIGPNCY